jgi:hypothetical protein
MLSKTKSRLACGVGEKDNLAKHIFLHAGFAASEGQGGNERKWKKKKALENACR